MPSQPTGFCVLERKGLYKVAKVSNRKTDSLLRKKDWPARPMLRMGHLYDSCLFYDMDGGLSVTDSACYK